VTTEGPLSEISGPYFDRSNQLLQPIVAVAVLAASAGGAAGCLNHRRGQIPRAARTTDGSWCSRVIRRISADVDEARLGLCLGWRLRLCRKLKHRRLLTLV
jgi:hypothetical protein